MYINPQVLMHGRCIEINDLWVFCSSKCAGVTIAVSELFEASHLLIRFQCGNVLHDDAFIVCGDSRINDYVRTIRRTLRVVRVELVDGWDIL